MSAAPQEQTNFSNQCSCCRIGFKVLREDFVRFCFSFGVYRGFRFDKSNVCVKSPGTSSLEKMRLGRVPDATLKCVWAIPSTYGPV